MSLKHSNIAQPDPKKPQPGDWDCEHVDEKGNAPPGWAYGGADGRQILGIADPVGGGSSPILGVTSFTADDTGTAWAACPDIIQLGATLTSGTATTVLLEVRTSAGVVSTAATIVADTLNQTLSAAFVTQTFQSFRVHRSSGTGSVTITL